jgi:hypothetical protein
VNMVMDRRVPESARNFLTLFESLLDSQQGLCLVEFVLLCSSFARPR